MGEIRLTRRDYRQALSYYKELIEKYPASSLIPEAKYKLGMCYFELKEYDLAVANLEDRGKIVDPVKLQRIAEMLSVAYVSKKNFSLAVREYVYLAEHAQNEKQRAGYRDRVRELVDKYLTEDELRTLSAGAAFPSDEALLRLAALQIEQRNYRDAVRLSRNFSSVSPPTPRRPGGDAVE
jgi:tetratricopeptide (TPR) repeat protein